jgi:hypothetical protein
MNKKKIVILTLCLVLVAVPAHAFVAAWIQRALIIAQQVTQIGNQVEQIKQFQAKLDRIREQVTMVTDLKDSALGAIGGFKQEFTTLFSAPSDLVGDVMDNWGGEFHGEARQVFDAARSMARSGQSIREGWGGLLSQADQVTEQDILSLTSDLPPDIADRVIEQWRHRRTHANKLLVHDHTVADAAAALAKMLKESQGSIEKLRNHKGGDATALGQATVTGIATQGEILTAMAQLQAFLAARETAKSYEQEIQRRLSEAQVVAQQRREQEAANTLFDRPLIEADNEAWRKAWQPKIFSGRPEGPATFGD